MWRRTSTSCPAPRMASTRRASAAGRRLVGGTEGREGGCWPRNDTWFLVRPLILSFSFCFHFFFFFFLNEKNTRHGWFSFFSRRSLITRLLLFRSQAPCQSFCHSFPVLTACFARFPIFVSLFSPSLSLWPWWCFLVNYYLVGGRCCWWVTSECGSDWRHLGVGSSALAQFLGSFSSPLHQRPTVERLSMELTSLSNGVEWIDMEPSDPLGNMIVVRGASSRWRVVVWFVARLGWRLQLLAIRADPPHLSGCVVSQPGNL